MQKYKAKKEVVEEITQKLKADKNKDLSLEFVEKLQNNGINKGNNGKLEEFPSNSNIFARGDFDDYKITNEELLEHQEDIEKAVDTNKCSLEITTDKNGKIVHRWMKITDEELLKYKQNFTNAIKQFIERGYTQNSMITVLPSTPAILQKYSKMRNDKIVIEPKILRKILTKVNSKKSHNHNMPVSLVNDIPIQLTKPLSILKNKENNHIIIITEQFYKKRPVICAIEVSKNIGNCITVNSLRSFHDKRIENCLTFIDSKEMLYEDKKKMEVLREYLHNKGSVSLKNPSKNVQFSAEQRAYSEKPFPNRNSIISYSQNMSSKINKSLTFSGYKLQGRTKLYGMDISIENKKGSYRKGVDSDGHKWKTLMHYDYGYIRGTIGTDSDHVDCYIGPDKKATKVYIIHQNNPVTHKYDEDKCMLCFSNSNEAKKAYMKQYDRPGFFGSMETMNIDEFKSFVFSKQGKKIHKSFDVKITDITEANKNKKIEQLQKSLNATYFNKPFVIKHIPDNDGSKKYGDITLRITDFDKSKIEKAVHKLAFSLDADLESSNFGEAFKYKAQEELTNNIVNEITKITNSVYEFVINYFDLPEIRILSKAYLTYKGKIVYNSETGKPIDKKDWNNFVKALEDFLNRNYKGIGKKIVLKGDSLGRILERLSKKMPMAKLTKLPLAEIKTENKTLDWISEDIKNMQDVFGETINRERAARIQIAVDSAAQKVTKVTDNMRNDIQQIIIDGIKNKESKSKVSQNLFDKCVGLNRDFQKIADTEIQNSVNNAYLKEEVYNAKEGEKVYFKRFEILDDNTCKKCKKIKDTVVLWSDIPLPDEKINDKYAKYAIWDGKDSGDIPNGVMHPYCYSDDTEVMTNNGWKLFKDVLDDDLIMSINPDTHEVDFLPFINKISYQYDGEMISFPGRNFDLLVTPNHNMLIEERKSKKWHGIKAEDLLNKMVFQIPRSQGIWKASNPETIKIGNIDYSYKQYIKLWAWYLSEGSGRKKSNNAYEIKLAQKNVNKILNDIPEFKDVVCIGKEALYFTGEIAKKFEQMFGIYAADKYIPDFIKNSNSDVIRDFLYSFNLGDGSKRNRENIKNNSLGIKKSHVFVVRTSSKKMADDLCELIIKAGWMPSIYITKQKGKEVMFRNGTYKLNTDCYVINICKSKNKVYSKQVNPGHPEFHLPYKLNYRGMVYDVELEKWHFLLVKRNGKCGWSGNCRGSWYRYYPDADKD